MNSFVDLLFLVNVAFLAGGHELAAVRRGEWRFFAAFTPLGDQTAYRLFVALHVPLFVLIVWYRQAIPFQLGFDIFMIIHAGLHWFLRRHPQVDFDDWFSRWWIFGGAGLGALHMILLW